MYLYDMLFMSQSQQNLVLDLHWVKDLLQNVGFVINYEKSVLLSQSLEFLGFLLDMCTSQLKLPSLKLKNPCM